MGATFDPLLGQLRTKDLSGTSSPLTTKGDLYGYSTTDARIPVGADGTVLTADSAQTLGVKWAAAGGTGTVTSVSVTTVNGISGTVATATTTPAISLTLGAITPTSVNSVVLSGSSTPTLAVTGTSSISGSNTGDQTITLTGAVTGSGTGSFATTLAIPGTLTVSSTNSNITAHTHAITSSSSPGAAASLLATDASGIIGSTGTRIVKGWFTDLTVTNTIDGSITGNAATVTTNANLTGVITSVGNATSIASQTGTGTTFVVDTSPTLVTPTLGVATATSINKVTITAPVTSATLTLVTGSSLITAGAFALTLTSTATSNATIPSGTNTLYSTKSGSITSAQLATSLTDETGSGSAVFATSPTLVTPALGTPSALVGTNITGTGASFTSGITQALASASTTVNVSSATAPSSGQVLTATSSTAATWQAVPAAVLPWTVVTGTTQTAAVNNGYFTNNAGLVTVTLPSTISVGQTVSVAGLGAGGWKIAQNASQLIHFGSSVTTTGTGGSLASVNQYDVVTLVCSVANTTFHVISSQGNITVV